MCFVWAFFVYFVGFHHCFFSPVILFFDVTNLLRIILQETYEVTDCYKADTGMADYSNIWIISNATLSRDGDYSTLTESTTGTTGVVTITNIPLTSYRIECDVFQIDGTKNEWLLTVLKNDYSAITSKDMVLGEWTHITCDLNNIEANSRIRLNTGGTCTTLRFKNFKLYPI